MTSVVPRPPYTREELDKLYPKDLDLELVQVLLRHGERTPVTTRFRNAGLPAYWPYCQAARHMRSVIYSPTDASTWDHLSWRRCMEGFGEDDSPIVATGPKSEVDGICNLGELTDKGRETTYDLGKRLRHLYIDQLGFMPASIANSNEIYLRSTPIPRALESVQQTFTGMYPPSTRAAGFPPPTIFQRSTPEETLYPNEGSCKRFRELCRAFAQKAADHWNDSEDMKYVNQKIGKWMPEVNGKLKVDSHPRLSGVMDTINSTLAHGPATRLPDEFYDERVRNVIERVGTEEWFDGYIKNKEYRTLGVGGVAGDVVQRMTSKAEESDLGTVLAGDPGKSRNGETSVKLGLSGCHDTTLAGLVAGLGAWNSQKWPPYTSHVAFEMFKKKDTSSASSLQQSTVETKSQPQEPQSVSRPGWIASMLGIFTTRPASIPSSTTDSIGRKPYAALSTFQKSKLENHYVRVRYNDTPIMIPACQKPGNHLPGDETFCTLEAFKRVVDGFTPKSWVGECTSNIGKEIVGTKALEGTIQPAGHIEEGC